MYNTKYICTYNEENVFNENDNITESDKEFVRDALYRQDILNIFKIEEFDMDNIDEYLKNLYDKIKENKEINLMLKKFANIYLSEDPEFGLVLLFSFDFLHLFHPFICEYLETGEISREKYDKLINLII
jgi:hypothetical protein